WLNFPRTTGCTTARTLRSIAGNKTNPTTPRWLARTVWLRSEGRGWSVQVWSDSGHSMVEPTALDCRVARLVGPDGSRGRFSATPRESVDRHHLRDDGDVHGVARHNRRQRLDSAHCRQSGRDG